MKQLDLQKVHKLLFEYIDDFRIPYNDRLTIYRFISKLSESKEFESKVNRVFSAIKLKQDKDVIEHALERRLSIPLRCEFCIRPYLKTKWSLYQFDQPILKGLDYKTARKIAYDINEAFSDSIRIGDKED